MSGKPGATENSNAVQVRLLFFGAARDAAGESEIDFKLKGPATSASALEEILTAFPDLRRFGRSLLLAVNHKYAPVNLEVRDGDELALFPPVSGG